MTYRGTTPTHLFYFPFKQQDVLYLSITYFQNGEVKIEKELSDVTFDVENQLISVQLSQQDTLSFDRIIGNFSDLNKSLVFVQIRVLLSDNTAWVSEFMKDRVGDILKDGIIPPVGGNQNETN